MSGFKLITMKRLFLFVVVVFFAFVACNNPPSHGENDLLILKEQVNSLQERIDSLVHELNKKEVLTVKSKQKNKRDRSVKNASASPQTVTTETSTVQNDNTWKSTQTNSKPAYQPKREKSSYEVRVGALCCDGSRSSATGRGACSHHGGVCQWLYQ